MADTGNTVSNGPVVNTPARSPQTSTPSGAVQAGATDVATIPVKSAGDVLAAVTVDGTSIFGDGASRPLGVVGGGGGTIIPPFSYVANGTESAAVAIPIPGAPLATAFKPLVQMSINSTGIGIISVTATNSVVTVNCTAKPANLDAFNVFLLKA